MKSTKFYCLVLMTKYLLKSMISWISFWILEIIRRKGYLNNYLKKLFCQAYYFDFRSNQNIFFVKHIESEKNKILEKELDE